MGLPKIILPSLLEAVKQSPTKAKVKAWCTKKDANKTLERLADVQRAGALARVGSMLLELVEAFSGVRRLCTLVCLVTTDLVAAPQAFCFAPGALKQSRCTKR